MNENLLRAVYVFGLLEGQGDIQGTDTIDETIEVCEKIVEDWGNFKDIQNSEEEGYIMAYAKRKLKQGWIRVETRFNDGKMHDWICENNSEYRDAYSELNVDYASENGFVWNEDTSFWEKTEITFK